MQSKKQELLKSTSAFCKQFLNEDFNLLCEKMINKMSRKRVVPFQSGRLDIWAASVVYALGQINFLFDKSTDPFVSRQQLCEFFNVKQSTISTKAAHIRRMFKMKHFDREFSTKAVANQNPLANMIMINGFLVPKEVLLASIDPEEQLLFKLEQHLPFKAKLDPEPVKYLQSQGMDISTDTVLKIISVMNTGTEGGIVCAAEMIGKKALAVSITHLQFQEEHPLKKEITEYQIKRTMILSNNRLR